MRRFNKVAYYKLYGLFTMDYLEKRNTLEIYMKHKYTFYHMKHIKCFYFSPETHRIFLNFCLIVHVKEIYRSIIVQRRVEFLLNFKVS